MMLITTLISRHHVFLAVFNPFHRTSQTHRGDQHQHILRIKLSANAKPTTGMTLMKLYLVFITPQHPDQSIAISMGYLRGAIEFQDIFISIIDADCASGFHWHAGMAAGP